VEVDIERSRDNVIPVLDKGFLELVDVMGDDRTVVNAARVSYGKETKELNDADKRLIHYLAKNGHVSPFYHPHLMFRVKAPISVQRQWFKHKIGTAENSESTRYIEVHEDFYVPQVFRKQSPDNKQGSLGICAESLQAWGQYTSIVKVAMQGYRNLLELGVAREQAREVLPLCTYTSWIWTASLMAVIHFLKLREDPHAQFEIREYARAMRKLAEVRFPVSLEAFVPR